MENGGHFAGRVLATLLVAAGTVGALLAPESAKAAAAPPNPGQIAAIDQYYETFPTSSGQRLSGRGGAAGAGAAAGGGAPVPPALETRIREEAGPDADALIDLASTSPAPSAVDEDAGAATEGMEDAATPSAADDPSFSEALAGATGAPATGRGWLLAGVLLVTTAALAAAALQRRRSAAHER